MNRLNSALWLILLIQLSLTAVVYWPQQPVPAANPAEPLLAAALAEVRSIKVADNQGNEALLQRVNGHWQLPATQYLPADGDLVERLLRVLTVAEQGYPVATSVAARQRFEVASYRFQRSVTLLGQDGVSLGTAFLGTAPAFRQVHARSEAEDAIYSIAFNSFDAPAHDAGWLDRSLLQISQPLRIQGPGFDLRRMDSGSWQAANGAAPEPRELEALLSSLANLQVEGIADTDQQRTLAEAAPAFRINASTAAGDRALAFYRLDAQHFVQDARHELFFTLSAYDFDRLNTLDASRLNGDP